jgi:hypothetical protein
MKTISIFDVQDINQALQAQHFDYVLKMKDVCGNQAIALECHGEEADIQELCDLINTILKPKYIQVQPGTINPLQLHVI